MGAAKALLPFKDGLLIDAVIARATPQVARLAIDAPQQANGTYRARYGAMAIADLYAEMLGPLCGIVTGLSWAKGDWLATFPCDTPFLPADLVAQLMHSRDGAPAVARHRGRMHGICGLWPKSSLPALKAGLESRTLRSIREALDALGGRECDIDAPDGAFFNVNTPEDLKEAERILLVRHGRP
ncbi:MAG: NTP transferase domain-containing protein [Alphaproteobacteria bacterium]|nr:NTP transferase domain-containing protein [Alphaproteobacteria bacterium]MBV9693227.1 NTP transferase domain-containing protein [Alphaproteobacteria bacterium]